LHWFTARERNAVKCVLAVPVDHFCEDCLNCEIGPVKSVAPRIETAGAIQVTTLDEDNAPQAWSVGTACGHDRVNQHGMASLISLLELLATAAVVVLRLPALG
jgi:hypothetical protein